MTQTPHTVTKNDIIILREHGFNDTAIHDATQIVSYFNYINRVADALGIEHETFIRPWEHSDQL